MKTRSLKIVCFVFLNFIFADSKITAAQREYLNVFRNIPRLFEFLLETLDERPQILEKNEAKVFKRNIRETDDTNSINEDNETIENRIKMEHDQTNDDEEDESKSLDYNDDYYVMDEEITQETQDQFAGFYLNKMTNGINALDSNDIAERAMQVEKYLEDYNSRR